MENDKLIADFMELIESSIPNTYYTKQTKLSDGVFGSGELVELKYDSSWDWLMPVVEKIESLGFVINVLSTPTISKRWYVHHIKIKKVEGEDYIVNTSSDYSNNESKICIYYKAVVEFIKWYNNP